MRKRQAEAQASETYKTDSQKKYALPLALSYGMLAEICQWLWELLLGVWGGWILLPLNAFAYRQLVQSL